MPCVRVFAEGNLMSLKIYTLSDKADAAEAKDEPAPAVAKTSAVQFDLWGRDRPERPS